MRLCKLSSYICRMEIKWFGMGYGMARPQGEVLKTTCGRQKNQGGFKTRAISGEC